MNGMRTLIRSGHSTSANDDILEGTAYADVGIELDDIFIEADGPAIDRRFVERRESVARAAFRERSHKQLIIVAIIVLALVGAVVAKSGIFNVRAIDVVGVSLGRQDEVRRVAAARGDSMVALDTSAIEQRILALPYVGSVAVDREFPNRLRLRIVELTPAAVAVAPHEVALIASNGRVLEHRSHTPRGMVRVTGFVALPRDGEDIRPVGIGALAAALPDSMRAELRSIDISDGSGIVVRLRTIEIRLGELQQLDLKLRTAEAVLSKANGCTKYVDVSTVSAPVAGC